MRRVVVRVVGIPCFISVETYLYENMCRVELTSLKMIFYIIDTITRKQCSTHIDTAEYG